MPDVNDRIKGALYGFIIGDSMGATTEFMDKAIIRNKFIEVNDIIGGGWLNISPGQVTDDTEMMICVAKAINSSDRVLGSMLDKTMSNLLEWYNKKPKDVGNQVARVLSAKTKEDRLIEADDPSAQGNGSLTRVLPCVLFRTGLEFAIKQSRLTHNNRVCDDVVYLYYRLLNSLLYSYDGYRSMSIYEQVCKREPTGHVETALTNACYFVSNSETFEEGMIAVVNDGGDADSIGAICGSILGAIHGYNAIPQRWIQKLDAGVKRDVDEIFKKVIK